MYIFESQDLSAFAVSFEKIPDTYSCESQYLLKCVVNFEEILDTIRCFHNEVSNVFDNACKKYLMKYKQR
jgi:hypothetical protein